VAANQKACAAQEYFVLVLVSVSFLVLFGGLFRDDTYALKKKNLLWFGAIEVRLISNNTLEGIALPYLIISKYPHAILFNI
jgi:hypothetical protein